MTCSYRITTNLCLNRIRDERRRAELLAENHRPGEEAQAPSAEARATLAAILEQVPDELREIDVGGFAAGDVLLLTEVDADDVRRTLIGLNARVREAGGAFRGPVDSAGRWPYLLGLPSGGVMNDKPGTTVQLQVTMDDETAQGAYVNMASISFTETEFVLDFMFVQPQQPRAKVRSRVITSPRHLKRLIAAMQDGLQRYEQRYGTVEPPTGGVPEFKLN